MNKDRIIRPSLCVSFFYAREAAGKSRLFKDTYCIELFSPRKIRFFFKSMRYRNTKYE